MITALQSNRPQEPLVVTKTPVAKTPKAGIASETALFVQDDTLLGMGLESLCGTRLAGLDIYCLSSKGLVEGRSRPLTVNFALIDATGHSEVAVLVRILHDAHGPVPIALVVGDERHCPSFVHDLIDRKEISGVIGAGATRENWEIVVQYLLSGGRYLPPSAEIVSSVVSNPTVPVIEGNSTLGGAIPSAENRPGHSAARSIPLTRREIDVMVLAAEGMQNKIIAHTLGLSEHTVKVHMQHAFRKLGAKNRTQAAGAFNALRR